MIAAEPGPLEQTLADNLEQAAVLRANGHTAQAASIERVCDEIRKAMPSFLTILSESEAMLRSGWTAARLRGRFPEWEAAGFAMLDERGKRRYRECIVPKRGDASADRLAGERGESLRGARHG